jgi:hypothetical protein
MFIINRLRNQKSIMYRLFGTTIVLEFCLFASQTEIKDGVQMKHGLHIYALQVESAPTNPIE